MSNISKVLVLMLLIFSLISPYQALAAEENNSSSAVSNSEEVPETSSSTNEDIMNTTDSNEGTDVSSDINSEIEDTLTEEKPETDNNDIKEDQENTSNVVDDELEVSEEPQEETPVPEASSEESETKSLEQDKESTDKSTDATTSIRSQSTLSTLSADNTITESYTSKLGHIRSSSVVIYSSLANNSTTFTAGSTYTNAVYYIKKQAVVNGQTYYLISRQPSSVNGVVGWVKAADLSTAAHTVVDKESKTFYIKGTGSAYSKAWGGSKDLIHQNLSIYKNQVFKVHLTEKVGNDVWYRGTLNGKTVWIHPNYLTNVKGTSTSKLGHLRSGNVKIYKVLGDASSAISAGDTYTNAVYYIKLQSEINGETYYLISRQPSSVNGVVGWVKATDLSTAAHTVVDKESKTFYIKGDGSTYSKAWGGRKDLVYQNLSVYKDQVFRVHLTEKVGSDVWYRGDLDGKTVWIHPKYVSAAEESRTSLLGHLRSESVKIYKSLGDESSFITAGTDYTNAVYYIKKQAIVNGKIHYLISEQPSNVNGIVGWVKKSDLSLAAHTVIDKKAKTYYVAGTGSAFSKAWGGSKDLVIQNLSEFKGQVFKVHLTESVGGDAWFRGDLNGQTVWIHPSLLTTPEESYTSQLGHLRSTDVMIYRIIKDDSSSFAAGTTYTHAVYYIKRLAKLDGEIYYLISTQPSSVNGVVGWVKASDLSTQPHTVVDKKEKSLFIKGTGSAYSKAWGGKKDLIFSDLSALANQEFKIHLTEKVGSSIWYRGTLNGQTVWIHEDYLRQGKEVISTYTNYSLSLTRMTEIQMAAAPMTDKRYKLWIREDAFKKGSIVNGKGTIEGDNWNLRRGPGTGYLSGGKVSNGTVLTLISSTKDSSGYTWYYVRDTSGWVTPDAADVSYYLNSSNFTSNLKNSLQFLKLSQSANVNVNEVNSKILYGKGILSGQAQAFVDAGRTYGVNEIYLISHALLETGNGTSILANGVEVGIDSKGNKVLVNSGNKSSLTNIKKTYNMYGIGAKDQCPLECGAIYAYDAGWYTPEIGIIGGASFIGAGYVNSGQDTLYKMRWNPEFAAKFNYASHQYATDIGWAFKQTSRMYELYELLDGYSLVLDIPKFN
ncbi:SH3-like domain-containing protein [Bacillus firmus]|uniref:N-acetylglucosaminidase n=1 Tax=Cytobacillus firmus TaxID=1399 RepID=UPI0015802626|nr:GW dipeptide domain-containing protein [Cytobacillus firmus]NUH85491.1 SH3-like domain-containing protein [Cytobacillus firmus]